MKIQFRHDYQQKIMYQAFEEPTVISTDADIIAWRTAWTDALKSWHSPYKAAIDVAKLTIAGDADKLKQGFERMQRFLSGFFLKKAAAFGYSEGRGLELLPFPVFPTDEEAFKELGIRGERQAGPAADFRATIQLQNHFNQHVVELNFSEPVTIDSKAQLLTLRSKLTNNLMQWHSSWNLLIDCTNLAFGEGVKEEWSAMERFFRGFFLKGVLGYSPRAPKESYPFEVYRARHNAAGRLESEGAFAGDAADCQSRK